jgi:hypothetical protein
MFFSQSPGFLEIKQQLKKWHKAIEALTRVGELSSNDVIDPNVRHQHYSICLQSSNAPH